jgi:hypothetical protein
VITLKEKCLDPGKHVPTTFCNGIALTLNKTSLCSLDAGKVLIKYQGLTWQARFPAREKPDKSKVMLMLKFTYIKFDIWR